MSLLLGGKKGYKFLAALAILHQDDLKKRMISSYSSNRPGTINPILQIFLVKNSIARQGIESILSPAATTFVFSSSVFILLV